MWLTHINPSNPACWTASHHIIIPTHFMCQPKPTTPQAHKAHHHHRITYQHHLSPNVQSVPTYSGHNWADIAAAANARQSSAARVFKCVHAVCVYFDFCVHVCIFIHSVWFMTVCVRVWFVHGRTAYMRTETGRRESATETTCARRTPHTSDKPTPAAKPQPHKSQNPQPPPINNRTHCDCASNSTRLCANRVVEWLYY